MADPPARLKWTDLVALVGGWVIFPSLATIASGWQIWLVGAAFALWSLMIAQSFYRKGREDAYSSAARTLTWMHTTGLRGVERAAQAAARSTLKRESEG